MHRSELLGASKSAGWAAGPDRDHIESLGSNGGARFGRGHRRVAAAPVLRATERQELRGDATRAPAAPAPIGPAVMSSAGTVVKTRAAVTLVRRAAAAGAPAAELQRVGAASGAPKGLQTPPARRTHTAAAAARRPLGTRAARRRAAPRSPFAPRAEPRPPRQRVRPPPPAAAAGAPPKGAKRSIGSGGPAQGGCARAADAPR